MLLSRVVIDLLHARSKRLGLGAGVTRLGKIGSFWTNWSSSCEIHISWQGRNLMMLSDSIVESHDTGRLMGKWVPQLHVHVCAYIMYMRLHTVRESCMWDPNPGTLSNGIPRVECKQSDLEDARDIHTRKHCNSPRWPPETIHRRPPFHQRVKTDYPPDSS